MVDTPFQELRNYTLVHWRTLPDIRTRFDHRNFQERGIEREPTTRSAPAATEMERRREQTDGGNINREAEQTNALIFPSQTRENAIDRVRDDAAFCAEGMKQNT